MIKNNQAKVKLDFYRLTGVAPLHRMNKISDNCLGKNVVFNNLAERVFDSPSLVEFLEKKVKQWLKIDRSEFTYMLAGYVYYFKEEFEISDKFFIKAINLNPENLDNWFCLAFSLYHQEEPEHNLAKNILFNFDYCIDKFKDTAVSKKALKDNLKDF